MTQGSGRALPYVGALDGLRAIAVLAVVAYHASLEGTPGGFFGVDVFFVISGYLVTSLFLGRVTDDTLRDTFEFWRRRLLRLIPAAVAAVVFTWLVFVAFDVRSIGSVTAEAFAALGYGANWFFLLREQSYFETIAQPSPFLHFWSLAVEAQFYLLWPILLLGAMKFGGRLATFALAVSLAAISTICVSALYDPSGDPSRAYYGTDARAAGLLLGAALAIVVRPGFSGRGARTAVEFSGWTGLVVFALLVTRVSEFDAFIYHGGFFLAATASVGITLAALHGRNSVSWVLSMQPLRWLGLRSYSIYLWHWPVFVLTQPQLSSELHSFSLLLARLGATLVLAEVSFRLVENRFRQGGEWWRLPRLARTSPQWWREPWSRPVGVVAVGLCAVVLAGGLPVRVGLASAFAEDSRQAAHVMPPAQISVTTYEQTSITAPTSTVRPFQDHELPASMVLVSPTAAPTSPAVIVMATDIEADTVSTASSASVSSPDTVSATGVSVATEITPGTATVSAIGDSVMLGAVEALQVAVPGIAIDAAVGRQFRAGVDAVAALREADALGEVVIVHLGHNGTFTESEFDSLLEALSDARLVVFLNITVPRRWESDVNDSLAGLAAGRAGVVLADWHGLSAHEAGFFAADGVHLTGEGQTAYAGLILEALATVD